MRLPIGPVVVSDRVVLIGGAVVLVVVGLGLWYVKRKATETVTDAANYIRRDAFNVTSSNNLPNTVVTGALQATGVLGTNKLTNQPNTIGSAVYFGVERVKGWF